MLEVLAAVVLLSVSCAGLVWALAGGWRWPRDQLRGLTGRRRRK